MSPRNRVEEPVEQLSTVQLIEYIIHGVLVCGVLAWLVFGIVFLTNDRKKCGGYNRFWVFCCASIFCALFGYFISLSIYVKDRAAEVHKYWHRIDEVGRFSYLSFGVFVLFEVPFLVWGVYSIFVQENVCHNELYNEDGSGNYGDLYIWAICTYVIRATYLLLNVVGTVVVHTRPEIDIKDSYGGEIAVGEGQDLVSDDA